MFLKHVEKNKTRYSFLIDKTVNNVFPKSSFGDVILEIYMTSNAEVCFASVTRRIQNINAKQRKSKRCVLHLSLRFEVYLENYATKNLACLDFVWLLSELVFLNHEHFSVPDFYGTPFRHVISMSKNQTDLLDILLFNQLYRPRSWNQIP